MYWLIIPAQHLLQVTLLVNIGAVPIDGIYLAYGTVSGSPTISSDLLEIDISDEAWKTYGKDGIFMTFFIKVSFAMIGIWNPNSSYCITCCSRYCNVYDGYIPTLLECYVNLYYNGCNNNMEGESKMRCSK